MSFTKPRREKYFVLRDQFVAFRSDCPEGHLEKGRFSEIYGTLAPPGADVQHHVDQIFRIFDRDGRLREFTIMVARWL